MKNMRPRPPSGKRPAWRSQKMAHTPNGRVISLAQKSGLRKRELVLQAVVEAERREDDEAVLFDRSTPMTLYELRKTLEESQSANAFSKGFEARSYAKFDLALKEYKQGCLRNPQDFKCLFNLGFVHGKLGNFAEAHTCFERAFNIRKDVPYAPFNSGVCAFFLGDYKGAVKSFDKAIALDSTIQSFYLARALAYRRMGEYHNNTVAIACEDYSRAKRLASREQLVYFDSRTAFSKDPLFDSLRLRRSLQLAKDDGEHLQTQICRSILEKNANQRTTEDSDSLAKLLARLGCFKNLDKEFIRQIASLLVLKTHKQNEVLFFEGSIGSVFYYILEGTLDVYKLQDESAEGEAKPGNMGMRVNQMHSGHHFGDSTLFNSRKRIATIVTSSPECAVVTINQDAFLGMYKPYMTLKHETTVTLFRQVSLLHGLTDAEIDHLAKSFKEVKYHYGSYLYERSSKPMGIYIVHQGLFKIVRRVRHGKDEEEVNIGTLASTDCFGHQTALNKELPSPEVSVICEHSASVFVLSKAALFDSTTFEVRTKMRRNLGMISSNLTSINRSEVKKRLADLKKWEEYKSQLVQSIMSKRK